MKVPFRKNIHNMPQDPPNPGFMQEKVKMFLKPVWVGKIHGVEVYATHVVRIWWFSNKFSIFQLKRM